jgi:hypothetical protein
MPKPRPKAKEITKPCYNLYKHRLGPFLGQTEDFLHIAKGQDLDQDASIDDTRR